MKGWPVKECPVNPSNPRLESVDQEIPADESINNQTLAGALGAPPGFIFVCRGQHFPWALSALGSWQRGGQCLLGHLPVPVNIRKKSEAPIGPLH